MSDKSQPDTIIVVEKIGNETKPLLRLAVGSALIFGLFGTALSVFNSFTSIKKETKK